MVASEEVELVESCESAVLAFLETVATMSMSVTTWLGLKAASVPWIIRRAEKTEAMIESNITAR